MLRSVVERVRRQKRMVQTGSGGRLLWLDVLRGATLCSMILYHGMWDAVWLYGFSAPWYLGRAGYLWQQSICWTFIFLSGFSYRLGKRHLKRGMQIFFAGGAVTLITLMIMPENRVVYGVLMLLGTLALLLILPDRRIRHILEVAREKDMRADIAGAACAERDWHRRRQLGMGGFLGSAVLFFLVRNVNSGSLGFERFILYRLPKGLYRNVLTAGLGFPPDTFFSTDYFSLLPWIFLFLCGYFTALFREGRQAEAREEQMQMSFRGMRLLAFLGRHTLPIYLVHQPLLLLLLETVKYFGR